MSEFSRPYIEEATQTYAPFPNSEFIDMVQVSQERLVGIYRVDNGTTDGEDVLVALPNDIGMHPLTTINPENSTEAAAPVLDLSTRLAEIKENARLIARDLFMVPDGEDGIQMMLAFPCELREMFQNSRAAIKSVANSYADQLNLNISLEPKKIAATIAAVGILASGIAIQEAGNDNNSLKSQSSDSKELVISYDKIGAFIPLDTSSQDAQTSIKDAATASGIPAQFIKIVDNKIYFTENAQKADPTAMKMAYLVASKPETKVPEVAVAPAEPTKNPIDVAPENNSRDVFASQRDNGDWGKRANGKTIDSSNTCNITSMTMALEKAGLLPAVPEGKQPEQLLIDYYHEALAPKGMDITEPDTLADIARHFGAKVSIGQLANTRDEWSQIQGQLDKGKTAIFSIDGHIIHLNAITADGIIVDDPAGKTILLHETADGWRSNAYPNYRDTSGKAWYGFDGMNSKNPSTPNEAGQPGDNNLLPWSDVDLYKHFGWLIMVSPPEAVSVPEQPTPEMQNYEQYMDSLISEIIGIEGEKGVWWDSINTGGAGDTKYGSARYKALLHDRQLSQLTIQEVLDMQAQGKLFAVGGFQFIPSTLHSAVGFTGIDKNRIFDEATQKELAINYLILGPKRTHLAAYIKSENDNIDAAVDDMCKEWASRSCSDSYNDRKGRPHGAGNYDGDKAGNNAVGGAKQIARTKEILQNVRNSYATKFLNPQPPETTVPPAPVPAPTTPRDVVMIGDSLTVGMQKYGEIETIDQKYGLNIIGIDGRVGRALEAGDDNGMDALVHMKDPIKDAEIVYLGLGTNAIGPDKSFEDDLRTAIDQIGTSKTIVIPHIFSEIPARDNRNAIIDKVVAEKGASVIDVGDAVKLGKDKIHPTNYKNLAERVDEEISKTPAVVPTTSDNTQPSVPTTTTSTPDPAILKQENTDSTIGWLSESQARDIYSIWFGKRTEVDGAVQYVLDDEAKKQLDQWMTQIPSRKNNDGVTIYEMDVNNMPNRAQIGEK